MEDCPCHRYFALDTLRFRVALGATWVRCPVCEICYEIPAWVRPHQDDVRAVAEFRARNPTWQLSPRPSNLLPMWHMLHGVEEVT